MVIKMLSDKSLIMTTPKSRLFQRESAIEAIILLLPATFHDNDMTGLVYTAVYKDPANESHMEVLTPEPELRDDVWIELHMPVDSKFTKMAGTNKLMILGTDMIEETGTSVVLETGEIDIVIEPVPDFFAYVSNDAINPIAEQLIQLQQKADELAAIQEQANQRAAKDLKYVDTGHINLVNEDDIPMGDGVDVIHYAKNAPHDDKDDGVVDLDNVEPDIPDDVTFIDLDG